MGMIARLLQALQAYRQLPPITEEDMYKGYKLPASDLQTMLELVIEFKSYHHDQLYDQYAGCFCTPCREIHLVIAGDAESFTRAQLERWLIRYYFSMTSSPVIVPRMEELELIPYRMIQETPQPRRLQLVTTEPVPQ